MRTRAKAIAATAVLAAAIGAAAIAIASHHETPPPSAASPTTTALAQVGQPSQAPLADSADGTAARAEATAFVTAWATPRWDDPAPGAWTARAAAHATDAFASQIRDAYAEGRGGTAWADLVSSRGIVQNVVDRLDPIPSAAGHHAYVVLYRTITITTGPGTETGETTMVDVVLEHGQWKVSAFGQITAGSATRQPSTAPAAAPTIADND